MHFPVFLDTCVLYPIVLTDTLLRVAEQSVFRPHWSVDAMMSGYEGLVDGMECDSKNRHVMAAAVHSDCQVVVTYNLKDFPTLVMTRHQLEAVHPDTFLLDQLDLYPEAVAHALLRQSADSARPRLTPLQLMASFEKLELKDFAAELRRRWPNLESGRW